MRLGRGRSCVVLPNFGILDLDPETLPDLLNGFADIFASMALTRGEYQIAAERQQNAAPSIDILASYGQSRELLSAGHMVGHAVSLLVGGVQPCSISVSMTFVA